MKKILSLTLFVCCSLLSVYCTAQCEICYDSLSSGMTSPGARVLALAMRDTNLSTYLFAGGHFNIAGRDTAMNIAEWIPVDYSYPQLGKWVALGTGVDNDVCALAMYKNYLFAGGKFDSADGIAASHIACWDTAVHKWDSLIGTLNGNVYALCVYDNALFVGGDFTTINGDTVNRIAEWRDSMWLPVGKGFDTGAVYALTVSNDTLYAGGSFLKSNGQTLNHIAKLKGANWAALGNGTDNTVYALSGWSAYLYVGGAFLKTGGITSKYFSSFDDYNTFQWVSQDGFVNDTVRALSQGIFFMAELQHTQHPGAWPNGNCLMVGGSFDTAYGVPDKYFTFFGGYPASYGYLSTPGPVYALATSGYYAGDFIGGEFDTGANGYFLDSLEALNNVAFILFNGPGGVPLITDKANVVVYPNPSMGMFTFQSSVVSGQLSVEVYNVLGEKVYTLTLPSGASATFQLDLSAQPNGIYLYRVLDRNGGLVGEGKLVIQQ